ncbi:MAG: alkaline phosphatase family protein [Acidobacteriota bacterium]|nr:alkaline phosphatase family protein [Acidobacteriota bacterium]
MKKKASSQLTSMPDAIRAAYRSGQEDEALEPMVLVDETGEPAGRIRSGDAVIFYDVRGEREVELTRCLTEPDFLHFPVVPGLNPDFVTLIEYASGLNVQVAFPPLERLKNTLSEALGSGGFRVLKVAESEKAIHVDYFFNGRNEDRRPWEERLVVDSPAVEDYSTTPAMSADAVAVAAVRALEGTGNRVVIANLANVDVVGHIENKSSVVAAVEAVDIALGRIVEGARRAGAALVVTADHGTVEEWFYPDGTPNTGHTANPVPFILADFSAAAAGSSSGALMKTGELADVAPTVLQLAGFPVPVEMTGKSLIDERDAAPCDRILLLILDGWGLRAEAWGNLIGEASTPHFDSLSTGYPMALLTAHGEAVGMPPGSVGNSEAGHLHMGAGRRVPLDRVRIDQAIEDGSFGRNAVLLDVMRRAMGAGRTLHLMGIVSHYSSHGTLNHLFALMRMARNVGLSNIEIHAFIGRRGERPESGAVYVESVEEMCRELGAGRVATVMGRFWSLDREEHWDRIEKTYGALVRGIGTPVAVPKKSE